MQPAVDLIEPMPYTAFQAYDPDNLFRLNQNIRPSKLPSKVVGT
jgi:hypothetical protein